MAKIKSISALVLYVKDLEKTQKFYEDLGFRFEERQADYMKAYINWFWVEFVLKDKAEESVFKKIADLDAEPKGAGLLVHLSVDNTDEFYDELVAKGIKPSSKPQDFKWGRREFVVCDPDGYKLVFFQKK
jgi:catechol 2,3-dioxygenase-like lactoylglutathione lyase family enzyme